MKTRLKIGASIGLRLGRDGGLLLDAYGEGSESVAMRHVNIGLPVAKVQDLNCFSNEYFAY